MSNEQVNPVLAGLPKVSGDFLSTSQDILGLQELGSAALKAYQLVKRRRLVGFLKTLDYEIARQGETAKQRLRALIDSDTGAEILADFAEASVRSSSRIVGAALAVLYTDTERQTYPSHFAAYACNALDGLSDVSIEVFLELTDVEAADRAPGEAGDDFEVYHFDKVSAHRPRILELAPTRSEQVAFVNELQDRGLVLREHASRFGGAGGSGITYGISSATKRIRHLLLRARSVLPEVGSDPSGAV